MTLAEIIFFCLFLAVIYRLLRPVERRLEGWIYGRLTSQRPGAKKPVIEIRNSQKNG
jgi:hypothetical protein